MSYYSSSSKEASLPQIQYSNIQSTERDFKVKSGDEMNKKNEKKQYAKTHQEPHEKTENQSCCSKKLCVIIFIVVLIFGVLDGLILFVFKSKCQQTTTQITPIITNTNTGMTVAIMGTNDLNGKVYPTKLLRPDTKQSYNYGGLATLITLRNIVSEEYKNNFLYLDAGDELVGGIQSSEFVSSGQIMNDFFKSANLTASAIGDHWSDWGPDFQLSYLKGRQTYNLAINIKPIAGQPEWIPNLKNSKIVNLPNEIKIGLIGFTSTDFQLLMIPKVRWSHDSIKFLYQSNNDPNIIINQSKELRAQGANAIVLVAHAGNSCENSFASGIWTNKNSQISQNVDPKNEISNLIDKLPEGTIDAVVQGNRNSFAHNYYKGIPFMGTTHGGYYTNFMYLNFDKDKKLINTSIEGPVSICQKVFQNTGRCDYVSAADISKAGKLVPWKFHGVDVTPNEEFNQIIKNKWGQKMSTNSDQILVNTEIELISSKEKESELGNLFANLIHQVVPTADFVILDPNIFRSRWYPGPITSKDFFEMFPFTNQIKTFTLTGAEIITSLKQVNNVFFPVWNLQPIFKNQRGKGAQQISFFSPKIGNGTLINHNSIYKGAIVSFSYEHGDKFSKYNQNRMKDIQTVGQFREKVKPFLKKLGTIKKGSLIDPLKPRAIVNYID